MQSTLIRQILLLFGFLAVLAACDSTVSRHAIPEVKPAGQNNSTQALEALDRAINADPARPGNYYRKAQILFDDSKLTEAKSAIEEALERNSTKPEYHFLLARIARKQGDYTAAYREAITAETYRYPFPDLQGFIAELFAERGNFKEALTYVNRALEEESDSRLMLIKGRSLIGLSDTLRGNQWLARAYETDTTYIPAIDYLITYFSESEENDTALYFVEKGLKLKPGNAGFTMQKVALLRRKGRVEDLPQLLQPLRGKVEFQDTVNHLLLDYYYTRYQYDSVNNLTQALLTADSAMILPRLYKARVLNKRGFHWSAVNEYKEILNLDSTQVIAQQEMADLRRKIAYLRSLEEAQKTSREIISIPTRKN